MKLDDLSAGHAPTDADDLLAPLLRAPTSPTPAGAVPARVGRLLAFAEPGGTPLVAFPGQPGAGALPARCTIDLRPEHIGLDVLLVFDDGDPLRPIVTGVLRGAAGWPLAPAPGQVQVDADGQRLTVTATEEMVLRCGKAVLTLRADGRIVLRGEEILTDAAGANRVRGGSVQLN